MYEYGVRRMKTKEFMVSAKKSKNFQTYEVSKTIILEEGDNEDDCISRVMHECRLRCEEQIKTDER